MTRTTAKPRTAPVIVALDAAWRESKIWLPRLKGKIWGFKVGSILYAERGPKVVEDVQKAGFRVFLDLKYHDIPNTVENAVRNAFSWGVDLLTVHACGGRAMLEAAAAHQRRNQTILAVTVLTSLDENDLQEIGVNRSLRSQVESLADLAVGSGIRGLVCSPREVRGLRGKFPKTVLVTPGVRFEQNLQDQKRTETLKATLESGASLAVVGRALTEAKDWRAVWQKVTFSTGVTS